MNKRNRLAFICTIAAVCTLFTTSAWAASANDKKTTVRQPVKTVQAKSSSASKKTTTAAKPVEESTDTVRIGIREGQGAYPLPVRRDWVSIAVSPFGRNRQPMCRLQ